MILVELFQKNKWEDISKRFVQLYPEQEKNLEGYEHIFDLIPTLEREDVKNMRLCIRHANDRDISPEDVREWEDVFGVDGEPLTDGDGNVCHDKNGLPIETTWALEFNSFGYWANLPLDEGSLKNYGEIDFICHALYEMTWFGFDQDQIKAQADEINRRYEEVENGTAKLIPWEDVKKSLEEKLGKNL